VSPDDAVMDGGRSSSAMEGKATLGESAQRFPVVATYACVRTSVFLVARSPLSSV
jgi:hypothetical protein